MKILMVASEATPYAKTGGLADVIGALPYALADKGEEVAVVLPLYRSTVAKFSVTHHVHDGMSIWMAAGLSFRVDLRRVLDRGVAFYFVDCPPLFDREGLYGEAGMDYPDNHVRFAVFCRSALNVVRSIFRPDIIHCHDWQAALVGPLMRHHLRGDPTFWGVRMLMTVHNLGYQGLFPRRALSEIGLGDDLFRPDLLEFWGGLNLLKGGIVFADAISTVSKAYAREVQTPEYGFGLDGLLRARSNDITGILNGVDYGEWSPEMDPYIAAHYSVDDLAGKRACKLDLLRTFRLPEVNLDRPVIGIVSRFVHQKGFDIIEPALNEILKGDVSLTAIGTGEPVFEQMMASIADRYPGKAAVKIAYSNEIAHKIEAGADLFLMPSHYEPCGLNQIYSLRYGTVPIVRATGGLDDTIDESTGFKFTDYTSRAMLDGIRRALAVWPDRERWKKLMQAGMRKDHSWSAAAAKYIELYRRMAVS